MSGLNIVIGLLASEPTVTAYTTEAGIYPGKIPQGADVPACVARIVGGTDGKHLSGANQYYTHRIRVECLAADAQTAHDLGNAVMARLECLINVAVDGYADVTVVFADTDMTDYGDDRLVDRRTLDFRVHWRRADG